MRKVFIIILILTIAIVFAQPTLAQENLSQNLSGRILLQVESHGEAWYVYPDDNKKYYLGRPKDAFGLMKNLGLGATHQFISSYTIYPDYVLGKILIDVDDHGKAYYIYPIDRKAYYLGKPADAFTIMRELSLGITNENINKITIGEYLIPRPTPPQIPTPIPIFPPCTNCQSSADQVLSSAASAIRSGNTAATLTYFTEDMQKAVEYTMDFLDDEGKSTLGNLMSGATLSSSTENEKRYTTEAYFSMGGYKVEISYHVQKQADDTWLLTNL